MVDRYFSKSLLAVIAESRQVAIALGDDYVDSFHVFLADCNLNQTYSIRSFCFENEAEYLRFWNEEKKTYNLAGFGFDTKKSLSVTVELENAFVRMKKLFLHDNDNLLEPAHLFYSLLVDNQSQLYYALELESVEESKELIQYYHSLGLNILI